MYIDKYEIGTGKKRRNVYGLHYSADETGTDNTREIARFDTLELATFVMKYMRGDVMSIEEEQAAKEAIKKADTAPAKVQATA